LCSLFINYGFFLVEKYEQVKITDFGLAKMLEYGHDEYEVVGGKVWIVFSSSCYSILHFLNLFSVKLSIV